MLPEQLEREIGAMRFQPVYVFLGEEEYLRRRALALLREGSLTPEALAFNYAEFNAGADAISHVLQVANTFPMMSPRRVVILYELEALKEGPDQEALSNYIGDPQKRTVFVLVAEDLDKRTRLFKLMKEKTCVVEFPKLKGPALERWTENTLRNRGYRISSAALKRLVDQGGANLQTLANEIEKLSLYCVNEKTISDEAVEELVGRNRNFIIFELTNALGKRDRQGALRILGILLESGERPGGVVAMMARHFRQVLIIKELQELGRDPREIGAAAQIHPYFASNFLREARDFDRSLAEWMYLRLAEADFRFKSSGVDERMFLEKLICAF
jgi:DNA polymerase III subunit delta